MAKATKAEANYRHSASKTRVNALSGSKSKHCSLCTMFVPPTPASAGAGDCTAVKKGEDGISPQGLCDYFERKGESKRGERWYGGNNG